MIFRFSIRLIDFLQTFGSRIITGNRTQFILTKFVIQATVFPAQNIDKNI